MNVLIKIFLAHDRPVEELEQLLGHINNAIIEAGYGNESFEDSYTTSLITVRQLPAEFTEEELLEDVRNSVAVVIPMTGEEDE
jgi:hypothetical protein